MVEIINTYSGALLCGIIIFSIIWSFINDINDKKLKK